VTREVRRAATPGGLLGAILLAACAGRLDEEAFRAQAVGDCDVADVHAEIIVPICTGACHSTDARIAELDLEAPDVATRLRDQPAARETCDALLIDTGDPAASLIATKVVQPPAGCGASMPPTGALPAEDVACIQAWIAEVAQ
jgi:hypothetical protein